MRLLILKPVPDVPVVTPFRSVLMGIGPFQTFHRWAQFQSFQTLNDKISRGELPRFEDSRNVEMTEGVGDQQAANPFGSEY
jgi:hypothetical protein